jgi:phytanoyl-CoA hydroxylase
LGLSSEQKSSFFKDGYIVVRNLLDAEEIQTLRERYERLATGKVADYPERHVSTREVEGRANFGQTHSEAPKVMSTKHSCGHNRRGTQVYPTGEDNFAEKRRAAVDDSIDAVTKLNVPSRFDSAFDSVARSSKVVDIIEDLMGPNIKLYYDQVFAKPPYAPANRYHQDSVFWSFFASNFQITCQILLDDATPENGCLRVIPASHDFGLVGWDHLPHLLSEEVLAQEVEIPLKAGDATFHHSLTLHCSGPNTTSTRRRGWSIHYVSADTRYIGTPEESERIKTLDCLTGPEPTNGWPLIRGQEFPSCV